MDWVAGSASGASRNTGMGGTGAQVILHQMNSILFLMITLAKLCIYNKGVLHPEIYFFNIDFF